MWLAIASFDFLESEWYSEGSCSVLQSDTVRAADPFYNDWHGNISS